jgi:CDP-glucose 4,6-dehydratase
MKNILTDLYNTFNGKTVLVTGHTGFKGSWLTVWLKLLGADLVGISLEPQTAPSHFYAANLTDGITDLRIDIRNQVDLEKVVLNCQPDFVFHLAAQSLVRRSYENPIETWNTNVLGTLNLLESLRKLDKACATVIITSDKCYNNVEWVWGYRETDPLGGTDPYSASKGAAELVVQSHIKSFFPSNTSRIRIASARAGNVIGGGDWASDRIIPDCVRAWSQGKKVELRKPYATRPWQHVLEPLSGYLRLAKALSIDADIHGEAFNFGPQSIQNHSVLDLVNEFGLHWDQVKWKDVSDSNDDRQESGLLKLNCDKAFHYLDWHAVMGFEDTVQMTAEWYKIYYTESSQIREIAEQQIIRYCLMAKNLDLSWAQ